VSLRAWHPPNTHPPPPCSKEVKPLKGREGEGKERKEGKEREGSIRKAILWSVLLALNL